MEKTFKFDSLVTGVALIVTGILFATLQSAFVSVLMTVTGVLAIIYGALCMINRDFVRGAVAVTAGVVVIVCGWLITQAALIIAGIAFLCYGVYIIVSKLPELKNRAFSEKALLMLKPAMWIILGVLLIAGGAKVLDVLFILIGVLAVIAGILTIIPPLRKKTEAVADSSEADKSDVDSEAAKPEEKQD